MMIPREKNIKKHFTLLISLLAPTRNMEPMSFSKDSEDISRSTFALMDISDKIGYNHRWP